MDCIKYVNTRPIQKFANIKKNAWFGNVSNPGAPLYQENSFAKYDYMQSSYDRRMQTCNKAYTISKGKVENYRNNIHYTHMRKFQLKVVYERKMKKREKIERAAIKIQKVIRGFLTRKKYQNELVGLTQKDVKVRLEYLEKSNFFFLYELGKAPEKAANLIQNSVKRFLFRCKIIKFRDFYEKLLRDRAERIFSVIRKHVGCYSCKLKIQNMRFLREREKKLFQIRRNLAISTIGRTYRRLKLTFKSLKHRISKYKRRLRNSYIYDVPLLNSGISRKSSIEAGSNINGSAIDILELQNIPEPDENSSSTSGNERYQRELLLKKQQQERVEKVFFGKISHSIREKPSSPPLLPFLYQKDIIEGVSIPNNYCNITRATASRISESRPKRYSPSLIKSHTPTPQLRFKSKRIISKPVPLYKKQTFSSKMSRWDAEAEIEEIAPNKPKPKARTDSKVMDYTFTHRQKLNFKRTEIRLELTRPSTNLILQEKKVGKKSRSLRPYTMMSQNVEFNP